MPGRYEHGLNLDRRKVQRIGAAIILNKHADFGSSAENLRY